MRRQISKWLGGAWPCALLLSALSLACSEDPAAGNGPSGGAGRSDASGGSANNAGGNGGVSHANGGRAATAGAAPSGTCQAQPELAPRFPDPSTLDPDLIARAAALLGSCVPDDGVARNAAHLWRAHLSAPRVYFRFNDQLACLANANCGCAAVEHCLGLVYRAAPAVCTGRCEGDVFTGCGDDVELSMNCRRFGLGCDSEASCVAETPAACERSEPPTCTAEGEVQFCDDGFLRKTPCQALGFSCAAGKCVGQGDSCPADSSASSESVAAIGTACSGRTMHACLGGRSTSIDCAAQGPGFSCQALDGSFFCGLAAECRPASNSAAPELAICDGTTLTFCNAGHLESVDCAELGFSGCNIDSKLGQYGCTPGNELQLAD